MAAKAVARPAGTGEQMKKIYIYASSVNNGLPVAVIELRKDQFDAASAQDRTDINVHISSTLTGLAFHTTTTIS